MTPEKVAKLAKKATKAGTVAKPRKTINDSKKSDFTIKKRNNTLASTFDYRTLQMNDKVAEIIAEDVKLWLQNNKPTSIKQYCKEREYIFRSFY